MHSSKPGHRAVVVIHASRRQAAELAPLDGTTNMEIPQRFNDYGCTDYFTSDTFTRGVWDEQSQLWVIVAADDVVERPELEFLIVGRPGCDGIEFGYRKGHAGLWAYHPIGREFTLVAPSISTLVERWLAGSITV